MDYLDEPCKIHFSAVCNYLQAMNITYTVNPGIVRGLDYYTNTAFEIIYEGLGAQNSLVGGGRYNGLIEQIGGKSIPAIGFAGGFERLLWALEEENIDLASAPKPDAYFVCVGENTRMQILPYLNALRTKGLLVDYDPDKNSLKAQLKAADASGAKYAIIIGENELAAKTVNLKNMQTGEQITIPMDAEQTIKRMRGF